MNKIKAPLFMMDESEFTGPEVADLHEALTLLGFEIFKEEKDRCLFGISTHNAVCDFQTQHHIYDTGSAGQVYTRTAEKINELIGQWTSELSDRMENSAQPEATPSASSQDTLAVSIGEITYRVNGKVFCPSCPDLERLDILVIDKNVGGHIKLTKVFTDVDGQYEATFGLSKLPGGKNRPDLQVCVYAGDVLLGTSEVRYNASKQETLNVLLDSKAASHLKSEHEVLTKALASHYKGALRDLRETDKQQDITYLANKTGWDARAVALAALADQFSTRTITKSGSPEIPQAFFYALFRAGLPADENSLYHTDVKTVENIWKKAIEQGVISKALADQIPELVVRFREISKDKWLSGPPLIGASSINEILSVSHLNDTNKKKLTGLYATHRNDLNTFWDAVKDSLGPEAAKRLQVDGKLGFLTINNAPLMQKLHVTVKDLNDPLKLVELAKTGYHRAASWNPLLTQEVPIPKEIPGDTQESRRANYASYLAAQVRLSYPTAAIAGMVKSGALKFKDTPDSVSEKVSALLLMLAEHKEKFEIGVHPVEQFIKHNKLNVDTETLQYVKQLQRVYQITPSDEALAGLMRRGIYSAYEVLRYDKDSFVRSFETDLGGAEDAALTYDKSVQVHNAVLNITLSYLTARTAPAIGVHSPAGILDPTPANTGDVIPTATLEKLFGSMDFCSCNHCRSILSPAAYLVDLLLFLQSDPDVWDNYVRIWRQDHSNAPYPFADQPAWQQFQRDWSTQHPGQVLPNTEISPFDVLMSRRPDIEHLPLTCENTNTALPYIDVVNETLEYFVANAAANIAQNPPNPPLAGYVGHDSNGIASEDLLASPQFAGDPTHITAYNNLRSERFPAPLPFHQRLENLRRYFNKFEIPLPLAMERFRKSDIMAINRTTTPSPPVTEYAWQDILMEEIGLSRDEYEILTESIAVPLRRMYGFPNSSTDADIIAALSNAKYFTRRLGISYEDIILILKTRFVNPNSYLIPKLERLGVSFMDLKNLKEANTRAADDAFDALLPTGVLAPDPTEYDNDIKAWVKRQENYDRIMKIITLTDPRAGTDTCSFDNLEFRYSQPITSPNDTSTRIGAVEFVRLLRFIRLWKKLGWTIGQTDATICALYREDMAPPDEGSIDLVHKLDTGFLILLPRLGVVKRVMKALKLTPDADLLPLLACFAPIDIYDSWEWVTEEDQSRRLRMIPSLYRQLFLNPAMLTQDSVFADNGYGGFFQSVSVSYRHPQSTLKQGIINIAPGRIRYNNTTERLSFTGILDIPTRDALKAVSGVSSGFQNAVNDLYRAQRLPTHAEVLRSAVNLTDEEYSRIVAALRYDSDTLLTFDSISEIFRRGWLARKLNLSVRELLLLMQLTGLDPFVLPSPPVNPPILRFIELVQSMEARSFKSAVALYLIWDQDLSGKSAPDPAQVTAFARTLRLALAAVEAEFANIVDPDGNIAQTLLAKVYGTDAATFFFGLLNGTFIEEVEFSDPDSVLVTGAMRQAIENAAGNTDAGVPKIAYDDFRKRLSYSGYLTDVVRDRIKRAAGSGQRQTAFRTAIDNLYQKIQDASTSFFARYPELRSPHDNYISDTARLVAEKRTILLDAILPELKQRRKRQTVIQSVSAMANTDLVFTQTFLNSSVPFPLHATGDVNQPALNDFLAVEDTGLSVQFFANNRATGRPLSDPAIPAIASNLNYTNMPPGANSAVWHGYLEAPESGFFKFHITVDTGATVELVLDDKSVNLPPNGTIRSNSVPIELQGGALYPIRIAVMDVQNVVQVKWEWQPAGQGLAVIPTRYLYPALPFGVFREAFIRFMKVASLATSLGLTANEMAYFATHPDYRINAQGSIDSNGQGWLNALPVADHLPPAAAAVVQRLNATLLTPLLGLLDFARIKTEISPGDESLLTVLQDPATATQNSDSLLFTITRWDRASLNSVLTRFRSTITDIGRFDVFRRVYNAFVLIRKMGISADALIQAITNEPVADTVPNLQAALRARYDVADWREVIRPINDEMRSLQRDALVAYILHQMRSDPSGSHIDMIDTADKLFEYFLMDVQMDPCMQTSRIRHALSSVQLFIERCLMNLEPRVSPAAINARQWAWMKRYRVWEANRKVFLFPENWLEPELRDDKSPFFRELESELLQSDITDDSAATALLNYLSKLEEVAKLETCGIFHTPPDPSKRIGEINHVVARTAGTNRKYYYRRQEGGYWTPWEHIKLDIEDNPVVPVVWKDRLFIFWLKILKLPSQDNKGKSSMMLDRRRIGANDRDGSSTSGSGTSSSDTSSGGTGGGEPVSGRTNTLAIDSATLYGEFRNQATDTNIEFTVQAVLCWSEYYNSKWQPTKTSDVNRPAGLGSVPQNEAFAFDRSNLLIDVWEEGNALRITIVGGPAPSSFLLYNTHSLPLREEDAPTDGSVRLQTMLDHPRRSLSLLNNRLAIGYYTRWQPDFPPDFVHSVLGKGIYGDQIIQPRHPLTHPEDAPFFYQDSNHVFYVTTEKPLTPVFNYQDVGITSISITGPAAEIPALMLKSQPFLPVYPGLWRNGGSADLSPGLADPGSIQRFITEDAYIHRGIGTSGVVIFNGRHIGLSGVITNERFGM